jgi:hypothetical protein
VLKKSNKNITGVHIYDKALLIIFFMLIVLIVFSTLFNPGQYDGSISLIRPARRHNSYGTQACHSHIEFTAGRSGQVDQITSG